MKVLKTLTLSVLFTFSLTLSASADPANWSQSDNKCPTTSDGFERDTGTVTGEQGTYYWCYWYDKEKGEHIISMRPIDLLGGFSRGYKQEGNLPPVYFKNRLKDCAQQYVDGGGFCGGI